MEVAKAPALQWVKNALKLGICSKISAPYSPMALQAIISSASIFSASFNISCVNSDIVFSFSKCAFQIFLLCSFIRCKAQCKFTAVGRDVSK